MILHAMLVSIQAAIDISSHLISQKDLGKPATYRETFDLLARGGMISEGLASCQGWTGGCKSLEQRGRQNLIDAKITTI